MNTDITRKITCVIVDDEDPAHDVLKFFIAKIPWLTYAGSSHNSIDALDLIQEKKPDIIFLDVNMPELSGIDLLGILQAPESHIIMTTAYSEYAIDGFAFDVVSFLLKPIGFDRFLKAVNKVNRLIAQNENFNDRNKVAPGNNTPETDLKSLPIPSPSIDSSSDLERIDSTIQEEYIWLRADRKMHCLWLKDIYYIEGLKDYVKVHHSNGVLVTLGSMTDMTKRLPEPPFIRTHRSYIVNRNCIKVIDGNMITMSKGLKVAIAVSSREEVLRKLTDR